MNCYLDNETCVVTSRATRRYVPSCHPTGAWLIKVHVAAESKRMAGATRAPQGQVSSLPMTRCGAARASRRQPWDKSKTPTCPPAPRQTLGVKIWTAAQMPSLSLPGGPRQEATAGGRLSTMRTPARTTTTNININNNGSRCNMLQCRHHLCIAILPRG